MPARTPAKTAITWKTQSFHTTPGAIKAIDEKARTIEHLISTQTTDRDGECVRSKGAKVDIYLKNNPLVFWNHSERFARGMEHELPIARCLDLSIDDTSITALTKFAGLAELHPFAERVWRLYSARFLNSWSIGFSTIKESRQKLQPDQVGRTIEAFELLEYSAVGLPSNSSAITQFMKSFGLPDGASELDLEKAIGLSPLAKYWEIAEQILPADGVKVLPTANDGESEDDFVGRCMGNPTMTAEYPDDAQRAAVCHAQYGKGKSAARERDEKAMVADPLLWNRDLSANWSTSSAPLWWRSNSMEWRAFTPAEMIAAKAERDDPLRWNRDLSAKLFDVTRERNPAATKEIELAARYLDCEIKELHRRDAVYAGTKMGAGLVALDEAIGDWSVEDVRHFVHTRGPENSGQAQQAEAPLEHDVVKLNSKVRRSFLLNGTRFMRNTDGKLVVRVEPEWRGISITVYAKDALGDEFLDRVAMRAAQLKYYKGESFSLSGEFLDATDETWDDVFLTPGNEKALKRVVELMNTHGAAMENRGVIMLGPPGSGKTLSARIMRNETRGHTKDEPPGTIRAINPTTFIWISARDFFRMGAFGGIEHAFETAKENAPSMLLFEDVDNWIGRGEIDLLKTTMDGAARTKGIVTVLTTNDPAHFPTALIDRPGRFHDVLKIDLPDADQRTRMLARWIPDLSATAAKAAVDGTDGYSGAHVRELARFAGIIREQDGIESPDEAIALALVKVREQRDLIGETHAAQGRYVPRATVVEMVKAAALVGGGIPLADRLIADVKAWETAQIDAINRDAAAKIRALGCKSFAGFEECGYTAPASGATSPPHVHDYELEIDDEGAFESGCAKHVADHSHRITAASIARGETEPSDGHAHALMTADDVMSALVANEPSPLLATLSLGLADAADDALIVLDVEGKSVSGARLGNAIRTVRGVLAGIEIKDGRVLAAANYAKLKTAHAMVAEVIAAHDASRPAPQEPARDDEAPKKSRTLAEDLTAAFHGSVGEVTETTDAELWFDGALARDLAERLAVHTGPGAAGR